MSDNLNVLEETKTKVSTLYLLEEQNNLLAHHSTASQLCSSMCVCFSIHFLLVRYHIILPSNSLFVDEPAFTEGKSYQELMFEIDRVKNQLPCKTVHVPTLNTEMGMFPILSDVIHVFEYCD